MKQHKCKLVRDFWSWETDKWTLISEKTGKSISIWANAWILRGDACLSGQNVTAFDTANFYHIIYRYAHGNIVDRTVNIECTTNEMKSWLALSKHPSTRV